MIIYTKLIIEFLLNNPIFTIALDAIADNQRAIVFDAMYKALIDTELWLSYTTSNLSDVTHEGIDERINGDVRRQVRLMHEMIRNRGIVVTEQE